MKPASTLRNPVNWLALAILLLTVFVYLPGLSGDYMFDDKPNLLDNQNLNLDSLSLNQLDAAAFSSRSGTLHRPVSMLSFALNRYFFGIAPESYKIVNLCIHLLTGLGLWQLGRLILRALRRRMNRLPAAADQWLPVVAAGLWLVHPLNLTPVLYIVQRMTELSTLFTVCGLILYLAGRLNMLDGRGGLALILTGMLGCGTLAVLSKENGILLPLYMLVLELTLFRFRDAHGQLQRSISLYFLLLVAVPGIVALTYLVAHPGTYLNYSGRSFTLEQRLLTEPRVLLFYLKLVFAPTVQELGLYHDDIPISHSLLDPPTTLLSVLFLCGMFSAGLALLRKAPLLSLGILWFFAGHALESTIIPLEIAHEHRNYLADYGILLAAGGFIAALPPRRLSPLLNSVLPALFLCLFSYTTWVRSSQWSDNVDQAIYEAAHHPDSPRAVFAAARIHARLAVNGRKASIAPAFRLLQRASRLDHGGIIPDVTTIKLASLLHEPVPAGAYDTILRKLENHPLNPSDITALQDLADCAGDPCRIAPEIMEEIFAASLRKENPNMLAAYGFYSINQRGDFNKGLTLFRRALELDSGEPQYWKNLINLLIAMNQFDEAEQKLQQLTTLNPPGLTNRDLAALHKKLDDARKKHALATGQPQGKT